MACPDCKNDVLCQKCLRLQLDQQRRDRDVTKRGKRQLFTPIPITTADLFED